MKTMAQIIKAHKEWPFFHAYHDSLYIIRHNCSKELVLREHGENRIYRLRNRSEKEIVVYKIDGGLINDKGAFRCDNGIYTVDNELFLIELKGTDLNHALDQINNTIELLIKKPNVKIKKLNARVVLSRVSVPRITFSKEKKLKQLLHKVYGGGDYKKQSRTLEDTI